MARVNRERRKNPLVLIGCEGRRNAEKIYFSNFSSRNCRIVFSPGNSTDPLGILEDTKRYMEKNEISADYGDRIFLVIDTDLNEGQINSIKSIRDECDKLGITIITSSPTFEIWYLMHFRDNQLRFNSSGDVKNAIKGIISNYKESMNLYPLISEKTATAIKRAKKIESQRIKDGEYDEYSCNPYSSIYIVLEEIENLQNQNNLR
ncbi:MAG: RloB family protein [Bacilli bacterium]|nr:RloB family protein [Bacilli bacterium]